MGGVMVNGRPVQVVGFQNQDELHAKFYSIAHRVEKADVLDLPEVIHERRTIELCPTAAQVYRQLEKDFIAEVNKGVVTAANALAKLLRLQQITSGFAAVEDENGNTTEEPVDSSKMAALLDIFEDLSPEEPIVVFAKFRHDLDTIRLAAELKARTHYELSGSKNTLAEWQTSTTGDVLGVQIQAGGVGIDLSRACYCVYYSIGFSLGDYEQSLARTHRSGQTRSITYIHLIAHGTVDEQVYQALEKKQQIVDYVLKGITNGS